MCLKKKEDKPNEMKSRGQGRSSLLRSGGAKGGYFFSCNFLFIFGRFREVIYLVNFKK